MKTSQLEAAENGDRTYFTGTACGKGHLAPRYTSTGSCVECLKISRKKHNQKIRDLLKKATK